MKHLSKVTALLLTLCLLFTFAVPTFAITKDEIAEKAQQTVDAAAAKSATMMSKGPVKEISASYNNPNGRVLSVAKCADPRNYPEDSIAGIQSCINMGVDIVSVSVQLTKDGKLVLSEDETMDRMLVTRENGASASGKISVHTLEDLQQNYYLRNAHGGSTQAATKQTIATLSDALKTIKDNCLMLITNGWQYAAEINAVARNANATEYLILAGATDPASIQKFVEETGAPVCHIAAYYVDGVSGFEVEEFTKNAISSGADLVIYETGNKKSPIFKKKNMKILKDNARAMISFTDEKTCGGYLDFSDGWEDMIETGFNVLETDDARAMAIYIATVEDYRTDITRLITQGQSINELSLDKDTKKQLKDVLNPAIELSSEGAVTLRQEVGIRFDLQDTLDQITKTGKAEYAGHLAWWAVLLIVLGVILLIVLIAILVLRLLNKLRSKEYQKRKKFKEKFEAQAEANMKEIEKMNESLPDYDEPEEEPVETVPEEPEEEPVEAAELVTPNIEIATPAETADPALEALLNEAMSEYMDAPEE